MKYLFTLMLFIISFDVFSYTPREGDIIFHTSRSAQSLAIQQATHSIYSHMGIIFIQDNKPYVYEAASKVKYTPLQEWINRGIDKKYIIKRLNNVDLNTTKVAQLKKVADTFINKPYDSLFGWSDEKIYCSELVWKIYDRALNIQIGKLQQLKDFDLSSPIVNTKLKERYGKKIPYHEKVITPSAMFESPLLITINK